MTLQDFANYSALMDAGLDADLESLEEKIRLTTDLCLQLRNENRDLRQTLAVLEGNRRELEQKIELARSRLENLLQRIPV